MIGVSPFSYTDRGNDMDFSTPNFWLLACVALLAVAIVWASLRARPARSGREVAYERGLTYALLELHRSDDKEETAERLFNEAREGQLHDPSPFDDAILDAVGAYLSVRDARHEALTEAIMRLRSMVDQGEASSSEVSVALGVLEEMAS